jgi:hypothetical protein
MKVSIHTINDFVNTLDGLVAHIQAIADCGPYIDEAGLEDKGRLGVALLAIIGDYAHELAAVSDAFAESLPRVPLVEDLS